MSDELRIMNRARRYGGGRQAELSSSADKTVIHLGVLPVESDASGARIFVWTGAKSSLRMDSQVESHFESSVGL